MTGGQGGEEVRHFYGEYFIGRWPSDLTITPVSRTIGANQVVDELILSFTHDIEMPAIIPGVAPTGRRVEAAFCFVVALRTARSHMNAYTGTRLRSWCRSGSWIRGVCPQQGWSRRDACWRRKNPGERAHTSGGGSSLCSKDALIPTVRAFELISSSYQMPFWRHRRRGRGHPSHPVRVYHPVTYGGSYVSAPQPMSRSNVACASQGTRRCPLQRRGPACSRP
jgi:hypothetical protein